MEKLLRHAELIQHEQGICEGEDRGHRPGDEHERAAD
jgi:hypothetical protein